MAVAAFALSTLANLKEELGIASGDTSKDTRLEKIINRTSLFIEGQLNRKLKARRYNNGGTTHTTTGVSDEDHIYFSGTLRAHGGDTFKDDSGYGLFYLPAWPIRSNGETGSVTFVLAALTDRLNDTWDTTTLVENTSYVVNRETGELRLLNGPFTPDVRNYRVTMCAGYLTGSGHPYVPDDLEGLCLELAKQVYRDSRTLASESIGTWSKTFNTAKDDPYVSGLIAKYSRIVL